MSLAEEDNDGNGGNQGPINGDNGGDEFTNIQLSGEDKGYNGGNQVANNLVPGEIQDVIGYQEPSIASSARSDNQPPVLASAGAADQVDQPALVNQNLAADPSSAAADHHITTGRSTEVSQTLAADSSIAAARITRVFVEEEHTNRDIDEIDTNVQVRDDVNLANPTIDEIDPNVQVPDDVNLTDPAAPAVHPGYGDPDLCVAVARAIGINDTFERLFYVVDSEATNEYIGWVPRTSLIVIPDLQRFLLSPVRHALHQKQNMEAYWKYLKKSKFKIIDIGGSRLIWRDGFRENGGNNITRGQTVARGLRAGRRGNPRDAPQGHPQEAPQGNPQEAPQGNPREAPQGHPQEAPQGNPQEAPQGHPQEAPQGNPPSSVTEQMHKIEHDVQQVWGTWVPGNDVPSREN